MTVKIMDESFPGSYYTTESPNTAIKNEILYEIRFAFSVTGVIMAAW
jgi:hypothetical protein